MVNSYLKKSKNESVVPNPIPSPLYGEGGIVFGVIGFLRV
jgi:hypothetical protein